MEILINGKREVCTSRTIAELLAKKGIPSDALVVELNGSIIKQGQWPNIMLKDNDILELLNFVGGG
jgi:sulfur carrier protein